MADNLYSVSSNMNPIADSATSTRKPTSNLGKDEFLKILVKQLGNQDPLEPVKDTDFIAQMAQFSSLEQMQNLNSNFLSMKANSMIGKTVIASTMIKDEDGNVAPREIIGRVDAIIRKNGVDYLQVGDYSITVEQVSTVFDEGGYTDGINKGAVLIGKYIEASMPGKNEGDAAEIITGKVADITIKGGQVYAVIGDREIPLAFISKISANPIGKDDDKVENS